MPNWPLIWEDHGLPLVGAAARKPHDAWSKVKEGPAVLPTVFEGHEIVWKKIARKLGFKYGRPVQQRAAIIGGRRRYHHRPLTSWKLPGNKGTLTITSDEMEAKSWNRLKGKKNPYTPRIKDVFGIELKNGKKFWAIHHENLAFPPPKDWYLFIDTFFRWRAMAKDALKPANPADVKEFVEWLLVPASGDPKTTKRRRQEQVVPFQMAKKREDKIDKVRKAIWKDPGLAAKVKWAKSALAFLKKNNIKHRDLDPSNLAKTTKGKPVLTNIAESRSRGKKVGRIGKVKGTVPLPSPKAWAAYEAIVRRLCGRKVSAMAQTPFATFEPVVLCATATGPEVLEAVSVILDDDHKIGAAATCNASRFVLTRFIHRNSDARLAVLMAANGLPLWVLADQPFNAEVVMAGMKKLAAHLPQLGPEAEVFIKRVARVLARMSVEEALKVMEVDRKVAGDPKALKKAHRAVSLKKHPDRGGSTEEMQRVNEAYDLLKVSRIDTEAPEDFRARQEREAAEAIKHINDLGNQIDKMIQPEKFAKHFEKHTGKKFKVKVDKKTKHGDRYGGHDLTWTSEDGHTIFTMSIDLDDWRQVRQLGGGDDEILAFDLRINQLIIHNNKKSKFKERTWKTTNKAKDVLDPAKQFPSAKIKKMVAGKEKKRKFMRRDMILGIDKYLDGQFEDDFARIPLGPEYPDEEIGWADVGPRAFKAFGYNRNILVMSRFAMGRGFAMWDASVQGPYVAKKGRTKIRLKASAAETEDLMVVLRDLKKQTAKIQDPKKLGKLVERAFDAAETMRVAREGGPKLGA